MPYTDPSDKQSYEKQVIEKKQEYSVQAAKPGIAHLAQGTPIVGTWDDHDYGGNGSGDDYQWKQESKQLFLDFMGHPADSTVRQRDGIYSSYLIGEGANRVNLILLDLRWWRNSHDPLGEEQWAWLAKQLGVVGNQSYDNSNGDETTPPPVLNILVSSTQLVVHDPVGNYWSIHKYVHACMCVFTRTHAHTHTHTNTNANTNTNTHTHTHTRTHTHAHTQTPIGDRWGQWSEAKQRLYAMLEASPVPTVAMSGDMHVAEISRDCGVLAHWGGLLDITTSGLTHNRSPWTGQAVCNPQRVSRQSFDLNWAQAAFDWPARTVTFAVRDKKGEVVFAETVDFGAKKTASECTTGQGAHLVCGLAFLIPQLVAIVLFAVGICVCLCLVWRDSKRRQLSYCVTFLDWAKAPLRFMRRMTGLAPPTRPESRD